MPWDPWIPDGVRYEAGVGNELEKKMREDEERGDPSGTENTPGPCWTWRVKTGRFFRDW